MASKKGKKAEGRVKTLPLRNLTGKQAKRVKGGAFTVKQKLTVNEKIGRD
jgi:hypothetical protein